MTSHAQHSVADAERSPGGPVLSGGALTAPARPRWLVPALAVGIVVLALVVSGVLSVSTVLYGGLIGGFLLMHHGGHGGHGGHDGHGGGSGGRGGRHGDQAASGENGDGTRSEVDLSARSSSTQVLEPRSTLRLDDRAGMRGGRVVADEQEQGTGSACH